MVASKIMYILLGVNIDPLGQCSNKTPPAFPVKLETVLGNNTNDR